MTDYKKKALADWLGCELADIDDGEDNQYTYGNEEYLVLTDEEADQLADNYIRDSVWAFNASFIEAFVPDGITEDIIKIIQEKYEDANKPLLSLIGDNLDMFIRDAIASDGRGHFISMYDGEEVEEGDYFIYRTN